MELEILHWFESLHNPVVNVLMYAVTTTGDYGIIWIVTAVFMLFLFSGKYRKEGLTVIIALILSLFMCNIIMKNVFQRTRPFIKDVTFENLYGIFGTIKDWSFPSGHTSASFASAVAILMWNKRMGLVSIIYAFFVALSRLYLTVHYPTDVLTSLILGCVYGLFAYLICRKMIQNSRRISAFLNGKNYRKEKT